MSDFFVRPQVEKENGTFSPSASSVDMKRHAPKNTVKRYTHGEEDPEIFNKIIARPPPPQEADEIIKVGSLLYHNIVNDHEYNCSTVVCRL